MKILLIGEYSNVHATLAEGLRALGHTVTVLSNGDFWKDYPRDIDLVRMPGHWGGIRYLLKAYAWLPRLRGYDVVQLINPKADRGWVEADWIRGAKGALFDRIADDCDGIVASLYENYVCCQPRYSGKLHFIPYPINLGKTTPKQPHPEYGGLRIFIGIPRERSVYKGTDVMLRALQHLERQYADRMEVVKVESVPFPIYQNLMNHSDVLVDQLYSYTPAMNGLLAMSKGLILVGGGEEVHYHLLQETELRPIINVRPTEDDVYEQIEKRLLLADPGERERLSAESVEYIRRHHDHVKVARQYIELWER